MNIRLHPDVELGDNMVRLVYPEPVFVAMVVLFE
jgi:hypothetical protein